MYPLTNELVKTFLTATGLCTHGPATSSIKATRLEAIDIPITVDNYWPCAHNKQIPALYLVVRKERARYFRGPANAHVRNEIS